MNAATAIIPDGLIQSVAQAMTALLGQREVERASSVQAQANQPENGVAAAPALTTRAVQANAAPVDLVAWLKANGFTGKDVDESDRAGRTPLHWAAQEGYADAVALLLVAGAKVDAVDNNGWTPLHRAAAYGHADVMAILLDAGAKVDAADADRQTPLREAAWKGQTKTARLLLAHGMQKLFECDSFSHPDGNEENPQFEKNNFMLGNYQTALNDGTLLEHLAKYPNEKIANNPFLKAIFRAQWPYIARRLNINWLHLFALTSPAEAQYNQQAAWVEVVLDRCPADQRNALLNALSLKEESPLYWAMEAGNEEFANILRERGADETAGKPLKDAVAAREKLLATLAAVKR